MDTIEIARRLAELGQTAEAQAAYRVVLQEVSEQNPELELEAASYLLQENIQDAESTIRDTDVADEMMAYTKNNILIQSAQAMLAQANQVPQGVLQLLQ